VKPADDFRRRDNHGAWDLGQLAVWKEALKILGIVPCCFTAFIIVMLVVMYAGPMVP
jgi:hypothetical protein